MKENSSIKMILRNKKKNFSTTSVICKNPLTQLKGLMFSTPLKKDQSILIKFKKERYIPIHMLFVFFPIDAVWLDSNNKILHIERNIKPFTPLIDPKKKAVSVLETPKNITKNLKVGDKLSTEQPLYL